MKQNEDGLKEVVEHLSKTKETAWMAEAVNKAIADLALLKKALDLYERERLRFKHTHPEMTGSYFLAGGYGDKDDNFLPEYVNICPAYGCAWVQVYKKTERSITYEGS